MGKKLKSDGYANWENDKGKEDDKKDEKEHQSGRTFYDTSLQKEEYTNPNPTPIRFTSKDLAFFQEIIDSKKSPELKNVSFLIRSFSRRQAKTWWREQDFPESELHQTTKSFIKTTDKIMQELAMKNIVIDQIDVILHKYQPEMARRIISTSVKGMSEEFMQWIYDAIDTIYDKKSSRDRMTSFDKKTLNHSAEEIKKYLKETDWIEDTWDKKDGSD